MKTTHLTFLVSLFSLSAFANDTIRVEQAHCSKPITFEQPYMQSEKDAQDISWNNKELFEKNKQNWQQIGTPNSITFGDTIKTLSQPSISTIRFTLRAKRYTIANLHLEKIGLHTIYANGNPTSNYLYLRPGDTQIDIVCFNQANEKHPFDLYLTGDTLPELKVNAKGKQMWTQQLMIAGPHYKNCSISPSGNYYFYVVEDKNKENKSTYTAYLKKTKDHKTIRQWSNYTQLSWLPNQESCYSIIKNKDGRPDLYITNPCTGESELLCSNLPCNGNFTLSPTLDYIIYTEIENGKGDLPGTHRIYEPDDRMPGWRSHSSIFRFDLKTKVTQRLTFGNTSIFLNDISNDGKKLLLTTNSFRCNRTPFSRTTALEMNIDSMTVDTLFSEEPFISNLKYSPDASTLLVKASPWAFDKIGSEVKTDQVPNSFDYRLYLYHPKHHMAEPLLCNFKPSVGKMMWNAKNNTIYFAAENGYDKSLYKLNPKTKDVKQISLPFTYVSNWNISTENKKPYIIALGQSGTTARQGVIGKIGGKLQNLNQINFDTLMADVELPTCHNWNFKATRGDSIQNFYFLPGDFDSNKKYPMVVYYYGGCSPTPKILEGFWPLSAIASQGYVVLVLEPSGATGFGQEFAARHVNTWGKESGDDIIEGVKKFCKEHTFVNDKKIGCMGASYGGFMTQYLQTRTDIFAAAISHAGISNITGYWGGGYWGYTYGETAEYGNFPWSNPELFVKQSPLYNADKIHTPLLLLHGTADTNVPTNQSQAMYTALRILNRPAAYVTFKNENHVLRDFNKRMIWQQVINAWFAMWLKDEPLWWNTLYPGDCFDKTKK